MFHVNNSTLALDTGILFIKFNILLGQLTNCWQRYTRASRHAVYYRDEQWPVAAVSITVIFHNHFLFSLVHEKCRLCWLRIVSSRTLDSFCSRRFSNISPFVNFYKSIGVVMFRRTRTDTESVISCFENDESATKWWGWLRCTILSPAWWLWVQISENTESMKVSRESTRPPA